MTMELGATVATTANRKYLSLRTGRLCETNKDPREGFVPWKTVNASGVEYHFFAKNYDDFVCYISDVRWSEREHDGQKYVGWNLTLDTGSGIEWVLQIGSQDRPYQTIMNILPNVDFTKPVRIVAFMGKSKQNKPQKVFLLTQNPDRTDKDWIRESVAAKWQDRALQQKIKDNIAAKKENKKIVPFTEEEERSIARNEDGTYNPDFPYIKENSTGKWNFSDWDDFLINRMNEIVIPAVKAAAAERPSIASQSDGVTHDDAPEYSGGDEYPPTPASDALVPQWQPEGDSDIPFGLIASLAPLGITAALILSQIGAVTV